MVATPAPLHPAPPPALPRGLMARIYLRSLAMQGSWNPQRMQNLGLLVTLLPWLRARHLTLSQRRRFCRKHYEFFNTNPYLATFIVGGLLRLEAENGEAGGAPAKLIHNFKNSLARTFASLGDQFYWLGLKPALLLTACCWGLAGRIWLALATVVVFALWQLVLRRRALAVGYRLGLEIVELLARPVWHRGITIAKRAGMTLGGLCVGGCLARLLWPAAAAGWQPWAAFALGLFLALGPVRRRPAEVLFLLALPLALVLTYV